MVKKDKNTENKILEAAKIVFERKGMYGARMQEIADEARINKALLHYYFRSKEKLFDAVFVDAFKSFFPNLHNIFDSDRDIKQKFEDVVTHYVSMISENPFLPVFIITEVNRDPMKMSALMEKMGANLKHIIAYLNKLRDNGDIPDIDPRHLIVNMISMTVFPYLGMPLFKPMLFGNDEAEVKRFLEERKQVILQTLLIK